MASKLVTILVPLPMYYNPDAAGRRRLIERRKFVRTAEEVAQRFGGGTLWRWPPGVAPSGYWWNRGILNIDTLALLEVDIPDTKQNRAWFEKWARETLLPRFRQDAIYLRFYGSGRRMAVVTVVREEAGR
jgi:hypothetical protein